MTREGLLLREVAPDWSAEEVQQLAEPRLITRSNIPAMTFAAPA